ncbi:hypothetical protein ABZ250_14175 [Streptomyces afghaniensis]|uniref:hypothetical protein n=1 Tax=Streptomyces afghaniensis TaxID=66865 RepID=UPI0033A199C8
MASLVAFVVLCVTLLLATKNLTLLTGATGTMKNVLISVIWGASRWPAERSRST